MWKIGQRNIVREGEGTGGGGGATTPATPPVTSPVTPPAAHPVAPWSGADGVWKLGEGEGAQPWYSVIPEPEARAHIEAKRYNNPGELALANYNLTRLQRGDPAVVGLPGENATPEDWNAFYGKLGRPESADGYEFKFAEGVTPDDGMVKFAKTTFHEAGLSPKQAQVVADKWNAYMAETTTALRTQAAQNNDREIGELQTRWGGDLEKNKAAGQRIVKALGLSADLIERVEQNVGSAAIVELLAAIGRRSDEGGFTTGNAGGDPNNPDTMTREQATQRVAQLQGDAEFQKKYTDRNHPGHADAVKTMERLFSKL